MTQETDTSQQFTQEQAQAMYTALRRTLQLYPNVNWDLIRDTLQAINKYHVAQRHRTFEIVDNDGNGHGYFDNRVEAYEVCNQMNHDTLATLQPAPVPAAPTGELSDTINGIHGMISRGELNYCPIHGNEIAKRLNGSWGCQECDWQQGYPIHEMYTAAAKADGESEGAS